MYAPVLATKILRRQKLKMRTITGGWPLEGSGPASAGRKTHQKCKFRFWPACLPPESRAAAVCAAGLCGFSF